MLGTTVRVSDKGHSLLRALAAQERKSLSDMLESLLEAERSRRFFADLDDAYIAAQHAAPEGMKAEQDRLDATLMDGLDANEVWTDDGSATKQ